MSALRTRLFLFSALCVMASAAAAHDGYRDDGYRRDGWRDAPQRFRCESQDSRPAYCRVDTRDGVRLVDRLSRAACIPGRTWGWDRRGVWVSDGCRAEFVAGGDRWRDRRDWDDDRRGWDDDDRYYDRDDRYGYRRGAAYPYVITCESQDGDYNFCRGVGGLREVRLQRQLSNASCRYNESWGYRGDGIWVSRGCRAEFAVY